MEFDWEMRRLRKHLKKGGGGAPPKKNTCHDRLYLHFLFSDPPDVSDAPPGRPDVYTDNCMIIFILYFVAIATGNKR